MMNSLEHSLDLLKDTYNYNHWIYSLLRPHIGVSVAEVGSGPGNLTQFLLSCRRVVCIEPHPEYQKTLLELAKVHRNIEVIGTHLEKIEKDRLPNDSFDTVLCINVLEHIDAQAEALTRMRAMLRKNGRILLYVPALEWAYGKIDRSMEHRRRYSRADLRRLARNIDMRVIKCHYVNFIGLFGWWWAGRIRKETFIDPKKAKYVDTIVPYLSSLERLIKPPLGQSLFMVLAKGE